MHRNERVSRQRPAIGKTASMVVFLAMFSGCTFVDELGVTPRSYKATDSNKINVPVVLVLSRDLSAATVSWKIGGPLFGDTYRESIGMSLEQEAEALAKAIFRQVTVVRAANNEKVPQGMPTLTVNVLASDRHMNRNFTGFNTINVLLHIEWTLRGLDKQVIWVHGVEGNGTESGRSWNFKEETVRAISKAIGDAFEKSYASAVDAPEIKGLEGLTSPD